MAKLTRVRSATGCPPLSSTWNLRVVDSASPLDLTPTEFELLRLFMQNPGRAFSREELVEKALVAAVGIIHVLAGERALGLTLPGGLRVLQFHCQVLRLTEGVEEVVPGLPAGNAEDINGAEGFAEGIAHLNGCQRLEVGPGLERPAEGLCWSAPGSDDPHAVSGDLATITARTCP